MVEETQNTAPDLTADQTIDKPALDSVRDRLVNAVASETSVEQPVAESPALEKPTEGENQNEEQFIEFVAKKSQELPEEPVENEGIEEEPKELPEKEPEHNEAIRTYHTDVAETIRNRKLSLTNIAMAEDVRQDRTAAAVTESALGDREKTNWKRLMINTVSIVLVIAGAGVLGFLYFQYQKQAGTDALVPENALVLANSNIALDVTEATRESLLETLAGIRKTATGNRNDVINVSLVSGLGEKTIPAKAFFEVLDVSSDPAFLRSVQEPFMLGVHVSDEPYFFLVLKTGFFENAFAALLRWEERLASELPFLVRQIKQQPIPVAPPMASTTDVATTSSQLSTTTPVIQTPEGTYQEETRTISLSFEDIVIHNKDVRARRGADGEIDLLYTFSDPQTLIITSNSKTLEAVLTRLTVARFKQ